jgi:hypothetical protein
MHPTSVHLMSVCFMGVYLTGVYLMGVYLMSMYLTGVHLTGVHVMGVHLMGVHLTDFMGYASHRRISHGHMSYRRVPYPLVGVRNAVPVFPHLNLRGISRLHTPRLEPITLLNQPIPNSNFTHLGTADS